MSRVTGTLVERTRAAVAQGDLLRAYDHARTGIDAGMESQELRYLLVLALSRMGDSERALRLYREYGLDRSDAIDHRAIAARLLKDRALARNTGNFRLQGLTEAHEAYLEVYRTSGDAFPAINAATLAFLAGRHDTARKMADEVLRMPHIKEAASYYDTATQAEALLLCGELDQARQALIKAKAYVADDFGAASSTLRQLRLLARAMHLPQDETATLLAPIAPPGVIHFCGHIFAAGSTGEAALANKISTMLTERCIGIGYGSIAAGADIVIAETIQSRGGEVHLILPFRMDDFLDQSVLPAGPSWQGRFEKCVENAASVTLASKLAYVGDPRQFAFASKIAMGMARLRAQFLQVEAHQIAVWDGKNGDSAAGTGADVRQWRAHDGQTSVISASGLNRDYPRPAPLDIEQYPRKLVAIMFADFSGFSRLEEAVLPTFWQEVMGRIAHVLDESDAGILARNSWGDALHAIISDVADAAKLGIDLAENLQGIDHEQLGLDQSDGMRIGLHFGPVFEMHDRIAGRTNFYGSEISKAARLEPVTPPGAVFVTEPFAAILALEAGNAFHCQYVGQVEFAKGYGKFPIYRLRRQCLTGTV